MLLINFHLNPIFFTCIYIQNNKKVEFFFFNFRCHNREMVRNAAVLFSTSLTCSWRVLQRILALSIFLTSWDFSLLSRLLYEVPKRICRCCAGVDLSVISCRWKITGLPLKAWKTSARKLSPWKREVMLMSFCSWFLTAW